MADPSPELISSIYKILVLYLAVQQPLTIKAIYNKYDPNGQYSKYTEPSWWHGNAKMVAEQIYESVKSNNVGLSLLQIIANVYPSVTGCSLATLMLSFEEYSYLWTTGNFCSAAPAGQINYEMISTVKSFLEAGPYDDAVSQMSQSLLINAQLIVTDTMTTACSSAFSYNNMSVQEFANICGCYMTPDKQFTGSEVALLTQHPECIPSCTDARVRRIVGGAPKTCQTDLCIADAINVSGTDKISISQVCPQCPKRHNCVCYIHVNGNLINNDACSSTTYVDANGNPYSYSPANGNNNPWYESLWSGISSAFGSKAFLFSILAAVILIIIIIMVVMLRRHFKDNPSATSRKSRPQNLPFAANGLQTEEMTEVPRTFSQNARII